MKRLLIPLALVLVFAAVASATNCDHASFWWKLDNAAAPATDVCPSGLDSNMTNGVTQWQFAPLANWSTFSTNHTQTSPSIVGIEARPAFNQFTGGNFSASAIVNFDQKEVGTDGGIVARFYGNVTSRQWEMTHRATNLISCDLRNNLSASFCDVTTSSGVVADVDYHVVCTYDYNTRKSTIWINGTTNASTTCAAGFNLNAYSQDTLVIGDTGSASYQPLSAQIDEVIVFYGYTLSPTEVQNLFSYGDIDGPIGALAVEFTPLSAAYNEATTLTATVSGNLTNATYWLWNISYNDTYTIIDNNVVGHVITFTPNVTGNWSVNLTITADGANATNITNLTVSTRPVANWTITTTTPWMALDSIQFNDTTNYSSYGPGSAWYWDFDDGNVSTTENATNTFNLPGEFEVCLMPANAYGLNASAAYCENVTINGMAISVYDEQNYSEISCWDLSLSNSSGTTYTATCLNNTWVWSNFSTVPTGVVTVGVSATGYIGRLYYRTYNLNTPLTLNAYLLDSVSGLYSYFIVQTATGAAIESALLTFTYNNGTDTLSISEYTTDSTGSATAWLDWTKTYVVTASKSGYTPVSKSITPQPTTYLIIMGSTSLFNYSHVNDSMWTFMIPTDPEVNVTVDTISAGVFDEDSGITVCGLNLTYANGTVFNSSTNVVEQRFCTNSIGLNNSGVMSDENFYALLYWIQNGTSGNGTQWYTPLNLDYALQDAQSGLHDYLGGTHARLILAVMITMFTGAAAAMYLGLGATVLMMAVSGLFFYWGWFAGYELMYIIVFVAGAALLYLETRT